MTIYPFNQAPVSNTDIICRQSRFWAMFGLLLASAFTGVGIYLLVSKKEMCISAVFISLGLLYGAVMYRRTVMVFSGANWLMCWNGQRMLIRLAQTYNRKTTDVFVAEIPQSEIEWVRCCHFTSITKGADGFESTRTRYLEIKTKTELPDELITRLRDAANPSQSGKLKVTFDMPVTALPDGIIRLMWMSTTNITVPGLKKTLNLLGRDLKVAPEENIVVDTTASGKEHKNMDDQIIALVQAGKTIDAIKLARTQYGFSLSDARQFVDELQNARQGK